MCRLKGLGVYFTRKLRNANWEQSKFLCPQSSGMAQTFGTNMCPCFRRDSSCTSQPCCRSPRTQARCTGSTRYETSGIWILPLTRSTVYTDGWTRSRRSRPLCTCSLGCRSWHGCCFPGRTRSVAGFQATLKRTLGSRDGTAPLRRGTTPPSCL